MSWWQVLLVWVSACFAGIAYGKNQVSDDTIQKRLEHMQDLIFQEQEKTEMIRQMWLDAEQKAETWERRYNALLPEEKEI